MLYQKYCNLYIWVWFIIVIILLIKLLQTICSVKEFIPITKTETKENMTDDQPRIKVFNFNTSWCGWSKRFQSDWDKFSTKVNDKINYPEYTHIDAIDVKCDDVNNNTMCKQYEVRGYPYVVVENNNIRTPYTGERTHSALINHVSKL
jgi:hypothetical protein